MPEFLRDLLDARLFSISGTPITLLTLIVVLGVVVLTLWAARLAERGTRRALALRGVTDLGTVGVATRLMRYLVLAVGLGVALQTVGINLAALFAAGAFFAIAAGFAMQNIAQNFVAGVILLIERTIKPGDVLQVEGRVVRVVSMGLRATVARTRDEEDVIIPNSILAQNTVTNYTLRDSVYRLRATVGVHYDSDLDRTFHVLQEAADAFPQRLPDYPARVLLLGFGSSSVDFEVLVWIQDPWFARVIGSELNRTLWRALQRADIRIAYPQLDLHLDAPAVAALRGGTRPGPAAHRERAP